MTVEIPAYLEIPLKRLAEEQGRSVSAVVEEVVTASLSALGVRVNGHAGAHTESGAGGISPVSAASPASPGSDYPLRGTVIFFDNSDEPAIPESDWEMLG